MRSIPQKRPEIAVELLNLVQEICAKSPDLSCFASTATLASALGRRKADVSAAKWHLIDTGQVFLSLRSNGNRRNPRHRLTIPDTIPDADFVTKRKRSKKRMSVIQSKDGQTSEPGVSPQPYNAMSRVPDPVPANLVGLSLWSDMPRLDVIDCYMKSGWNVCPLVPFGKTPTVKREQWAQVSRDAKIDHFYNNPDLNVGLWIEQYTVFDYDSDRQPENTLVAVRGDHHHNYFLAHPEIYNTQRDVAPDIDTRAPGGLIVLPPSIHETGMPYQWEILRSPEPVPDKLVELWRHRQTIGGPQGFRLDTLPAVIHKGQRDSYVWAYGRSLRAAGASFQQIDLQLRTLNRERLQPQFSERELAYKIRHVWEHRNRADWKQR